MPTAELTITYDGEALADGLMDVRELAPAILAAGSLLQKANRIDNGDRAEVSLKVRSEIKRGSFPVDFVVIQNLIDQAKTLLLHHPDIKDARDILETVFFYGGMFKGLFELIKWLRGKNLSDAGQVVFEKGNVRITIDGETESFRHTAFMLYSDSEARRAVGLMVAPLRRTGVDVLRVRSGEYTETVTKDEVDYFDFDFEGEAALDTTTEALVQIVTVSFDRKLKWRLFDGLRNFTAEMVDDEFWGAIDANQVRFSEGDQLRVMLRVQTYSVEGDLRQVRTVVKVLEHIPRLKPVRLPFPPHSEESTQN
ncbi:MAG TPA: hypothetical protein VG860_18135 [Terriglobia bacterium]|nr:hypothetical protein [Terriglobia bacterium]